MNPRELERCLEESEALQRLGVMEIIEIASDEGETDYILNVSWMHWQGAKGAHEQKMQEVQEALAFLPPGSPWHMV